jgi:hypothetical protein
VIALGKTPLDTGVMRCRKCWALRPLSAFEPRSNGRWQRRRKCRRCRQSVYRRYEAKRRERRRVAVENRIAGAEGPQLEALAARILDPRNNRHHQLRFVRALACRLKAGPLGAEGETATVADAGKSPSKFPKSPTLKHWSERLDFHQAEVFCRRELGLPPLPVQPRPLANARARALVRIGYTLINQSKARRRAERWAERLQTSAQTLRSPRRADQDLHPGPLPERRPTIADDSSRSLSLPPQTTTGPAMTNAEILSALASGRLTIEEAAAILVQLGPGLDHET